MKEYTILAALSVAAVVTVDILLGTRLVLKKKFWVFWVVMFAIIFIVNGFLTWRPVVTYGSEFYLGMRLFTIPVEDFLYGFSLLTGNIVIWEYYTVKKASGKRF